MSLSEPFSEFKDVNTSLNSSNVHKTSSTAVPGWLKSFEKNVADGFLIVLKAKFHGME
jgi:hypothetical protein